MRPWRCRRVCSVQERALAALADLALDSLPAGASLSEAERLRPAVGEGGARKEVEQGAGGVSITSVRCLGFSECPNHRSYVPLLSVMWAWV